MYKFDKYECAIAISYGPLSGGVEIRSLPCYAEEVQSSFSGRWSDQTVVGRTGSLMAYTGADNVPSSFSIDLHREMQVPNSPYSNSSAKGDAIDELVRFIKSGCYPQYNSSDSGGYMLPPKVIWKFGNLYISGRMNNVNATWKGPIIDKYYTVCSLSIQMLSADSQIIGMSEMRNSSSVNTQGHALASDRSLFQ